MANILKNKTYIIFSGILLVLAMLYFISIKKMRKQSFPKDPDRKISDLAYEYFDMSDNVNLYEHDGRAFLQTIKNKYDVILVDA